MLEYNTNTDVKIDDWPIAKLIRLHICFQEIHIYYLSACRVPCDSLLFHIVDRSTNPSVMLTINFVYNLR